MNARLGLWVLLSLVCGGYVFWIYRAREIPVRGRNSLALLRALALSALLLILVNPDIPGGGDPGAPWLLEDASPSMSVLQEAPGGAAVTPDGRRASLPGPAAGVRVDSFGTGGDGEGSRLAPSLVRALEAGARSVEVRSDLRIQDPVAVAAVLESARVPVTFTDLGGDVRNAGVSGLRLVDGTEPGAPLTGEVTLHVEGVDSVRLRLALADRPALDTLLRGLPSGRTRVPLRIPAPDTAGILPVTVSVDAAGDVHPADDRYLDVVAVNPDRGDVVVVSWAPDWEPRFLVPVLAQVTGLSTRSYLRIGPDRFLAASTGASLDAREVRAALEEARLVVTHARPTEADTALARILSEAPARIDLPGGADPEGQPGEWYLSADVPPSPVAGLVSGIPLLGLPPLTGVRTGAGGPGGEASRETGVPALLLQRGGAGAAVPAVLLEDRGDRRQARARARGFWRWAFREGPSRELYRRFWSGVAGWLLAAPAARPERVGTGPVAFRVAPGSETAWRAGGAAGGQLTVTYRAMERLPDGGEDSGNASADRSGPSDPTGGPAAPGGSPAGEDSLRVAAPVDSLGQAALPAPEVPGIYRWTATVQGGDADEGAREGLLAVQSPALDLLPPRAVSLRERTAGDGARPGREGTRPLRTHPAPYILLVVLLSAEWIGRRRTGLR